MTPIRHPRTWPLAISLFLGLTVTFTMFGLITERTPESFDYWFAALIVAIALGISLLGSRVCWWFFSTLGVVALSSQAWELWTIKGLIRRIEWEGWTNIVLQTIAVVLVLSPPMIRWIRPIGKPRRFAGEAKADRKSDVTPTRKIS